MVFTDPVFAALLERARPRGTGRHGGHDRRGVGRGRVRDDWRTLGYEDLLAVGRPVMPPEPDEDDAAILMYTGGTTGFPKGALLEQRAEVLNVYHVLSDIGLREERRFPLPVAHVPRRSRRRRTRDSRDRGDLGDDPAVRPGARAARHRGAEIDTTMVVPIMLSMLERVEGFSPERLRSLRQLVYGASPISQDLIARWLKMLPDTDFIQGYGMTEAASALTFLGPEEHRRGGDALTTPAGLCLESRSHHRLARQRTPPGGGGGVRPRRKPHAGILEEAGGDQAVNARRLVSHRRHGLLRRSGLLHLTDRMKDMIVTGGENVYSIEVENALASHPAVAEVAVIGIPSESGARPYMRLSSSTGMKATAEELIEYTRQFLAGFKVPKSVEFQDGPLPLSGAFKPLNRELRRTYWENQERQVS